MKTGVYPDIFLDQFAMENTIETMADKHKFLLGIIINEIV